MRLEKTIKCLRKENNYYGIGFIISTIGTHYRDINKAYIKRMTYNDKESSPFYLSTNYDKYFL